MKRPLCLISMALFAAVCILTLFIPYKTFYDEVDEQETMLVGRVYRKEVKKGYTGDLVNVIYVNSLDNPKINVQCYMEETSYVEPSIDSYVKLTGKAKNFKIATNPGEFDSRKYYRILKISYRMTGCHISAVSSNGNIYKESLYRLSRYFAGVLDKCLTAHDAGIMKAILLGDRSTIDEEVTELYKKSNIISIIAVSGLHISILGMGLYKLLRRLKLGVVPSVIISIFFMYSYGIMCGMGTSAFRAIIMFTIRLLSYVIGRTYDMLTGMAVAGILILIEQPLYVMHSGFLMSFGAVVALGFIAPELRPVVSFGVKEKEYVDNNDNFQKLKNSIFNLIHNSKNALQTSFAIAVVAMPVYMSYYYTFSLYSPLINLLILPLMPFLIILGIIVIISGIFITQLGSAAGTLIHIILSFYELCCNMSQMIPGNTLYIGHAGRIQIIIYIIMVIIFVSFSSMMRDVFIEKCISKRSPFFKLKKNAYLLIIRYKKKFELLRYVWLIIAFFILFLRIKPDIRVTYLDVGQGDGIIIEAEGTNIMIDGGSTSKKEVYKYQIKPYLLYQGIKTLDMIILTHEDEDHLSGIVGLLNELPKGEIKVGRLVLPDIASESKGDNYLKLEKLARDKGISIEYISRSKGVSIGDISFTCLAPQKEMRTEEPNAYSTVMLMRKGKFSTLFTGDVDGTGQERLTNYLEDNKELVQNLTVLKVAHHGSKYTTDKRFLDICRPQACVISCGINNKYGHPHEELMERIKNIGSKIYVTKDDGAITVTYNFHRVSIERFLALRFQKHEY
ncbi:MAG: DNA internalization-related competence protein ComEC/Rec2 [Butyrivibrio sp.]|nr:DNA internalization-related competence protein ComEC/Rec2 [Butyrivibrio sp.]